MRRNGNGGKAGNGSGGSLPRWVRTLFDRHEARMEALERFIRTVQREEIETRRQTREIVLEIGRIDRERTAERAAAAKDRVEFVAALRDIRDSLKGLHGRVSRLEGE